MKKNPRPKNKMPKSLTLIAVFLVIVGIAASTYLVQKRVDLYTRSQTPLRPLAQSGCPTTSVQTYSSFRQNPNAPNRVNFDLSKSGETNLYLRGFTEINESKELISRNGNNYGLDPNMPPQISTLFATHYPKIIKTYRIFAWDFENQKSVPEPATPAYPVHMLGLEATAGEPLLGLKARPGIDKVFLVMYATKNYILLIHSDQDTWDNFGAAGYPYYFLDICVDPNLLADYERDNANGRNELPAVTVGQPFGYAMTNEVKFVIRDTGSFMDTRYKEDWWEYGGFKPDFTAPSQKNTIIPTQIPTSLPIPTPTSIVIPTSPPLPTVTSIPTQAIKPTQSNIYVFPSPTAIPIPTTTLTPTPTKTLTQIIVENPIFNLMKALSEKISLFLKVSLP